MIEMDGQNQMNFNIDSDRQRLNTLNEHGRTQNKTLSDRLRMRFYLREARFRPRLYLTKARLRTIPVRAHNAAINIHEITAKYIVYFCIITTGPYSSRYFRAYQ